MTPLMCRFPPISQIAKVNKINVQTHSLVNLLSLTWSHEETVIWINRKLRKVSMRSFTPPNQPSKSSLAWTYLQITTNNKFWLTLTTTSSTRSLCLRAWINRSEAFWQSWVYSICGLPRILWGLWPRLVSWSWTKSRPMMLIEGVLAWVHRVMQTGPSKYIQICVSLNPRYVVWKTRIVSNKPS